MKREKLSVTVITYNEEDNITDCLESLKWADEIVVVDCGSSDRTVEISGKYTDRVFHNPWPGHKEQKNFAVAKASHLWILSIDADERVTYELRDYILKELQSPHFNGYRFPRKNHFLGKWLRHGGWYPDHVLRLFRKDKGYFGGINPHDKVVIEAGMVGTVPVPLLHFTYKSFSQYESKIISYSSIAARMKYEAGRKFPFISVLTPVKTLTKFIEVYFIKLGLLDGYLGLVVAMASSYSAFWKYAKIWELKTQNRSSSRKG